MTFTGIRNFGELMASIIEESGGAITRQSFVLATGAAESTVFDWFHGRRQPSLAKLSLMTHNLPNETARERVRQYVLDSISRRNMPVVNVEHKLSQAIPDAMEVVAEKAQAITDALADGRVHESEWPAIEMAAVKLQGVASRVLSYRPPLMKLTS